MSLLDTVLLSIHGIFGILWIALEFVLMISLFRLKENDTLSKGVKAGIRGSRGAGGLTIIMGIVLFAILSSQSELPSFSSLPGILLIIGVVIALLVYVVLNEGILFRKLKGSLDIRSARIMSAVSAFLTLLVLVLMVAGAM
jgi:hypothetical protein